MKACNSNDIALSASEKEMIFSDFFRSYQRTVYNYLLLFVKIPEVAEELTADVFVKLWEKDLNTEAIESPENFLFIASKRKAIDFLRCAANNPRLQNLVNETVLGFQDSEDFVGQLEYRDLVNEMVNALPEKRRKIFIMNRLDGFSYEEIANSLNISVNTVRNTLAATSKQLKKLVFTSRGAEACVAAIFLIAHLG